MCQFSQLVSCLYCPGARLAFVDFFLIFKWDILTCVKQIQQESKSNLDIYALSRSLNRFISVGWTVCCKHCCSLKCTFSSEDLNISCNINYTLNAPSIYIKLHLCCWVCLCVTFCLSPSPPGAGALSRMVDIWKLICSFFDVSLGHPLCQKPPRHLSGTTSVLLDSMVTLWTHIGDGALPR